MLITFAIFLQKRNASQSVLNRFADVEIYLHEAQIIKCKQTKL